MTLPLPCTLDKAHEQIVTLFVRNEELAGQLEAMAARAADLERQVDWFKKQIFGAKSERRAPAPADTLTGDLFGHPCEPTPDEIQEEISESAAKPRRHRQARKSLPAELPRREILHDVEPAEKICPCCGKEKARIGEDVTELLEVVPAQVYVERHVRPKYACPSCKNGVAQAALPPQPAPRASVGPGFLAWLIVSKYADHLPLCRLERIFERHGVDLPRARMCDWLMTVSDLVRPLTAAMMKKVRDGPVVQADETSIHLQSKEKKGKTETAWVWVYAGSEEAPCTVFDFRKSRGRAGPAEMLAGFEGTLQCDGYVAYDGVGAPGKVVRAGCWAHARRGFIEAEEAGDTRAAPALACIKQLFEIEREWKQQEAEIMRPSLTIVTAPGLAEVTASGSMEVTMQGGGLGQGDDPDCDARREPRREGYEARHEEDGVFLDAHCETPGAGGDSGHDSRCEPRRDDAQREARHEECGVSHEEHCKTPGEGGGPDYAERLRLRREKSAPVVEALRAWMAERYDVLPKSPLGAAIGYAQNQWPALTRFLDDGRVELDNNAAERALRPVAVGRKNWLFAGSERGGRAAATFFTLIESARRNGLNPFDYLRDILGRLPSHPINRITDLLPDRWKSSPKT